ncbi:MAG TPA: carboxypeptidase regulatory-like domain-containing protein [Blastocatellia bacterium]|nr:carboxypeptidase regulatory-like domain-containing protein [Blastocatellia bacterium]
MSIWRSVGWLLLLALGSGPAAAAAQGFSVFGSVSLPDGSRAAHVRVKIEGMNGLTREARTDDQGQYEFSAIPGGRYRLTAVNPSDPAHYTDPVEADTSRSAGRRLQVNIYFRVPPGGAKGAPPGHTVSVAEATQKVPKAARKAYEKGLKLKGGSKTDEALASFDEAVRLYADYFQAFSERAELRLKRGEARAAAEDFARALELNEDYLPALRGGGSLLLQQRSFADAAEYFGRAARLDPGVALDHLFLGYAELVLDRRAEARQGLEQALALDAKRAARARVYLAELDGREGKFKEAADGLATYLAENPEAPDAAKLRSLEIQLRARSVKPNSAKP